MYLCPCIVCKVHENNAVCEGGQELWIVQSSFGTMLLLSWILALCGFVGLCTCFGETCWLHLQGWSDKAGKWRAYIGSGERRLRNGANQRQRTWEKDSIDLINSLQKQTAVLRISQIIIKVLQSQTWSLRDRVHHWLKKRSARENKTCDKITTTTRTVITVI
jgi:hypothetical protein